MHYQQGYVKNRGWATQTQFVTDVPHFQANHFSSQDNEEAPQPQNIHPGTHTYTHTLLLIQYIKSPRAVMNVDSQAVASIHNQFKMVPATFIEFHINRRDN